MYVHLTVLAILGKKDFSLKIIFYIWYFFYILAFPATYFYVYF